MNSTASNACGAPISTKRRRTLADLLLVAVGKIGRGPEADLFARYNARLRPAFSVREIAEGSGAGAEIKRREAAAILAAVPGPAIAVALDLGGATPDSEAFSASLTRWRESGKALCFIIGGAEGMVGAAVLAARAALFMGPGKVFLGIAAKDTPEYDPLNPEIMVRKADELIAMEGIDALAIGMGMGTDRTAPRLLAATLALNVPVVLDADALNLISTTPAFAAAVANEVSNTSTGAVIKPKLAEMPHQRSTFILTPHPGEAARLLNVSVAHLEADRVTSALVLAKRFNAVVVLKGAGTIIATPEDRYFINTSGNPGMASGGMGDALSGMIASLLAQGLSALDAARLAVFLHGAAADACIAHGMAPHGLTASEVIFEARALLNAGLAHHDHG